MPGQAFKPELLQLRQETTSTLHFFLNLMHELNTTNAVMGLFSLLELIILTIGIKIVSTPFLLTQNLTELLKMCRDFLNSDIISRSFR